MVDNTNESKQPSNSEFADIKKYIGVASVNVLAINPNNEKMRKFGWSIAEDAEEPKYVTIVERDGQQQKRARVRFLVQIQDLEDKPIIPLDFWIQPENLVNKERTKAKIIDAYGRTAWGTRAEITNKEIPQYSSGSASISVPYKYCHPGEEEIVKFMLRYLNVTPLQIFDRNRNDWVASKNPGRLTIDNWDLLCNGNIKELAEYISLQPNNCLKVVLGVRTTEDNKTYQTFLNTGYIGNGASPDRNTGEYTSARKLIDKYFEGRDNSPYSFSAMPVREWKETATAVKDNSDAMFNDASTTTYEGPDMPNFDDDLPFNMK